MNDFTTELIISIVKEVKDLLIKEYILVELKTAANILLKTTLTVF